MFCLQRTCPRQKKKNLEGTVLQFLKRYYKFSNFSSNCDELEKILFLSTLEVA